VVASANPFDRTATVASANAYDMIARSGTYVRPCARPGQLESVGARSTLPDLS
jgi:hypothetical protein